MFGRLTVLTVMSVLLCTIEKSFSLSSAGDAFRAIAEDVTSASQILLNVEYEANGVKMASILNASNKEDVAKGLISEGRGSRDG